MKKRNAAKPHKSAARRETRFARGLAALLASAVVVLLATACAAPFGASLVLAGTAAHAPVPLAAADDAAGALGAEHDGAQGASAHPAVAGSLGKTLSASLFGDAEQDYNAATSDASAAPAADADILEESIETPDGASFDVRVAYDAAAQLPDDAKLEVKQVVQAPEGYAADDPAWQGRPDSTERFADAGHLEQLGEQLEECLKITGEDYSSAYYLIIRIVSDGEQVRPAAPVAVAVRADVLHASAGRAVRAALLEGEGTALDAIALESDEGTAFAFETEALGAFGFASVAAAPDGDAVEPNAPAVQEEPADGEGERDARDDGAAADAADGEHAADEDDGAGSAHAPDGASAADEAAEATSPLMRAIIEQNIAEGRTATSDSRVTFALEAAYNGSSASLQQALTTHGGSAYRVRVVYGEDAEIPHGSRLVVRELQGEELDAAQASAEQALAATAGYLRAFDIGIVDGNGIEVEPAAPVDVRITIEDAPALGDASIVHVDAASMEVIEPKVKAASAESSFSFSADAFSVYVLAGNTVKRASETSGGKRYSVTMTCGGAIGEFSTTSDDDPSFLLSNVLGQLKISKTGGSEGAEIGVNDVSGVSVLDSAEDTASGELLKCVEITPSEPGGAVTNDWKLTVLRPFDTLMLRLALKGGDSERFIDIEMKAIQLFTVTWKNDDGTVLKTVENVESGATPNYGGADPTKEETAQYTYTFAGWAPEVAPVTEDATYTATYTPTLKSYTVTWINEDGTTLAIYTVEYGETPTYRTGETPTKASTAEEDFTFAGWTPEIATVTGDVTYKATFSSEPRKYTITWQNADGTTLKTDQVAYGDTPAYSGTEPAWQKSDNDADYAFIGWTPAITAVAGDATYTAQYAEAVLEIELKDSLDSTKPIAGATFKLYNDANPSNPVWTGRTDDNGKVRLSKVDDETNQESLDEFKKGARFDAGGSYTLKQTGTATGYVVPKGTWTIEVGADGKIVSTVTRNAGWDDYTTLPSSSVTKYGIRIDLQNAKQATLTYHYNMPDGAQNVEDQTVPLDTLSYNLNYPIGVNDPTVEGYEFVGWLDENNKAVKKGDTITINTVNTKDHVLNACWRIPLNVVAKTYSGGNIGSAAEVPGSKDAFTTDEVYRNYTNLSEFCQDYGEKTPAVKSLNDGKEYEFVQASVGEKIISALRYDNTEHKWQYQVGLANNWRDLALTDELALYYAYNKVNVTWVRMDDDGSLSPLDATAYLDKEIQIDSVFGITQEDIFKLIGTDSREGIVEKDCYFLWFGLGANSATNISGLAVKGLTTLAVKNRVNGFVYGADNTSITGLGTIYAVYSPAPPENSAYLNIENYTQLDYAIDSITVGGVNLLSAYRAILINRDANGTVSSLFIYDGGSKPKHAKTQLTKSGGKAELVLLNAAGAANGRYVLKGSFKDTDGVSDKYEMDEAIASANTVTHTLLKKAYKRATGDIENQLVNRATEGWLDSSSAGKVTIAFDDDLAPFTFEKKWSMDAQPEALTVNYNIFEIPNTSESNLPSEFNKNAENNADDLRKEGATVWEYNSGGTSTNAKEGWIHKTQNLPKRNLYYAVETDIMNGSVRDARNFGKVYELTAAEGGGWKQAVTNNLLDKMCRVAKNGGSNEYEKFKTIQQAVNYITANSMTKATIEMLCDYVMTDKYKGPDGEEENAVVTIPSGYDITLTSKRGSDGSDETFTVSRGFTGTSMFTVNGNLTIENLKLSARQDSGNNYYACESQGAFVNVANDAKLTVKDGVEMRNGRATAGSAVYVQDGGTAVFEGGTITGNRTTDEDISGAVAVGGANAHIELSGNVWISNNYPAGNSNQRNIYLDKDSNAVIQVVGALGAEAQVGVYVPDDNYSVHGQPSKPFATYVGGASGTLDKLVNDRYRNSGAGKGYASKVMDNTVVWGPTFDLTVDVSWLNAQYKKLSSIPEDAQVEISLNPESNKGFSTQEQKNVTVSVEGSAMTHTFRGLAVYQTGGSLCEYYVKQEKIVTLEKGYKQIKFIGDVGVKKLDSNDSDPKNVNIPLRYIAGMAEAKKVHEVHLYEHLDKASFTIHKVAENLESGQTLTSSFALYGVKKGLGMGGSDDLPMVLRQTGTPDVWKPEIVWSRSDGEPVALPVTTGFFQVGGGNQWYCQVSERTVTGKQMKDGIESVATGNGANGLVKFHSFIDDGGTAAAVAGDVKFSDGAYQVYTGSDWYKLDGSGTGETQINYTRQDGYEGALDRDGGIQLQHDKGPVTSYEDDEGKQLPIQVTTDTSTNEGSLQVQNLSSEYYWYAVETSVTERGGQGRTLNSFEWLVAAYDPHYSYDQAGQTVTVTNKLRNGLATYKKWPTNSNGGTAKFEVYKMEGADIKEPFNEDDLKHLIGKAYDKVNGKDKLTLERTFTLPEENGSYVHVEKDIDFSNGTYFVKEVEANGFTSLKADVQSSTDQSADCKYWPYERLNHENGQLGLYTIHNENEILCKVVDPDETEHPFRSLKAAYEYGKSNYNTKFQDGFTIEMLKDYTVPADDCLVIENGRKVTLTTATEGITEGKLTYSGAGDTRAILTRHDSNRNSFIHVTGNANSAGSTALTLNNIEFTYSGTNTVSQKISNTTYYHGAYVYAENAAVALASADGTADAGVKMTGGRANNGGAIYVKNGNLNAEWAQFENCESVQSDGDGGAVWVEGGATELAHSAFVNCNAKRHGGAIAAVKNGASTKTTIKACTFQTCTAGSWGGAVYSQNETLTVGGAEADDTCLFDGCTAVTRGGALCHHDPNHTPTTSTTIKDNLTSETVVQNAFFRGCRTTSASGDDNQGGGAVCSLANELCMTSCEFEDCTTNRRGGAALHVNLSAKLTKFEGCTFKSCTSNNSGGGGVCIMGRTQELKNCKFTDCRATASAGGAVDSAMHGAVNKEVTVEDCTFTRCIAGSATGGAICAGGKTLTLYRSTFAECSSAKSNGGAVSMTAGGDMELIAIYGCTFENCTAASTGAAVYGQCKDIVIESDGGERSVFTSCNGSNVGGAINHLGSSGAYSAYSFTARDADFSQCSSSGSYGGAVRTAAQNTIELEACTFTDCTSLNNGGGLYTDSTNAGLKLTVTGTSFMRCACTSNGSNGGGIYTKAPTVSVTGNYAGGEQALFAFDSCTAVDGAGLYQDSNLGTIEVENATFNTCRADRTGGGMRTNASGVAVKDCTFKACKIDNSNNGGQGGGGMYVANDTLGTATTIQGTTFDGCTVGKRADTNGGGVYTSSRTLTVKGSEFTGNTTTAQGGGIFHYTANTGVKTEATIADTTFKNCQALSSGGGVHTNARNVSMENCELSSCKISQQTGDTYGGGLRVACSQELSSTTLKGVRITDCEATTVGSTQGYGGGVYTISRTLTVGDYEDEDENAVHSSFTGCSATHSGGAICQKNDNVLSSVEIAGASFENCTGTWSGGAVHSNAFGTTITDCAFKQCHVDYNGNGSNYGGALRVDNNSTRTASGGTSPTDTRSHLVVSGTSFDECYANVVGYNGSKGGAIYTSTRVLIMKNNTTVTNSHAQYVGGIFHDNSSDGSITSLDGLTMENCYSSVGDGGGLYAKSKTMTVNDTRVEGCYANNWGGGIYHDNSSATVTVTKSRFEDCRTTTNGGGGMRTNALKLDIEDTVFARCHTEAYQGGALYHGNNSNAETTVAGSTFEDCSCPRDKDGGAIYHYAKKLTLTDTVIDGNTGSENKVNAANGGGIYSYYAELTLIGCTIRNCSASNCGGGIYQNGTNSKSVVLDDTKLLGNSAANNPQDTAGSNWKNNGGAVYFGSTSTLTLCNGVVVSGNKLRYANSSVEVAAGIYIYQYNTNASGTLVVGTQGSSKADTITVWDNTAADGKQSNVRLNRAGSKNNTWDRWNNRDTSVMLYSDLKDSHIGVVNPGVPGTQFGVSNPNNHDGAGGFVSDDGTMTGKINPSYTEQIIWYKPPVCKITDSNGNVLSYTNGGSTKTAVYDTLSEAINEFNRGNTSAGHFYSGSNPDVPVEPVQIQMLIPNCKLVGSDTTLPAFTRTVTITTAQAGDTDRYYYPSGAPDAVIERGDASGSMFSARGVAVTITRLTLDGGSTQVNANGSLFNAQGTRLTLGTGAVLQNGSTSNYGGAVYLADASTLTMMQDAMIQNCQAAKGGAVYVNSGSTMEMTYRSSVNGNSASQKGGAVYVAAGGSVNLDGTVDGLSIKDNHVAANDGGAGIYLDGITSRIELSGILDFDGNTVTTGNAEGVENGAEAYPNARQDLYLAANSSSDLSTITIAGNLTNGHGEDGFIWVWADNQNHYKLDDQFALVKQGVEVQGFTLNAFRDARDDATTGNITDQYYTGVADLHNPQRVLWGVDIVPVTFSKTDDKSAPLSGAVFTVYPSTGDGNQDKDLETPLKYRSGAEVKAESDKDGTVAIKNVLRSGRTYYMRETATPTTDASGETASFGENDSLYRIAIDANESVKIEEQKSGKWAELTKKNGLYQIVNKPVICKVVDTRGEEHPFDRLNGAVEFIRGHSATAYVNGVATVQMLVDYTVPRADRVELQNGDAIVLTTAHTAKAKASGERFVYVGENGDTAVLRRGEGYSNFSMASVAGSGKLALAKITFDGKLKGKVQQAGVDGGFIALSDSAVLTVGKGATLQNIKSTGAGGAVHAAAGTKLTVDGGAFSNCTANGNGGAIYARGSVVLGGENASSITRCTAQLENGGAVYVENDQTKLDFTNFTISDSKAVAGNGGAVYFKSDANNKVAVKLVNSKLGVAGKENSAAMMGGSLYTKADKLTLAVDEQSTIGYGKTTYSNASYGGGAVAHERVGENGGTFTLTGVEDESGEVKFGKVTDGSSKASGGGLDIKAARVELVGARIEKCESAGSGGNGGGAVRLRGLSVLKMDGCTINSCASATVGGGVMVDGASTDVQEHSSIENSTFTACTASKSGGKGGGVYVKSAALDVKGCTFGVETDNSNTRNNNRCQANTDGGAIYAEGATLKVDSDGAEEHTAFYGNNASYGGGIGTSRNSIVKVHGAAFEYCSASYGGGVYSNGSTVTLDEAKLTSCSGTGGGLYVADSNAQVEGCKFTTCSGGSGGAIRVGNEQRKQLIVEDKVTDEAPGYIPTEFYGSRATNDNDTSGSALYIEYGGEVTLQGHTLITARKSKDSDSVVAPRSGAVYVAGGGLLHLKGSEEFGPTIADYHQPTDNNNNNGPAIYLGFSNSTTYGKVTLKGKVSFENNLSGQSYEGSLGGRAQDGVLQEDIFLWLGSHDNANKNNMPLEAITVKGELTGSDIWVFASDDKNESADADGAKHFKRGDQFAISVDTEEAKISDATLAKFKNARLDADTDNVSGAQLVGVRGERDSWVYWGEQNTGSRKVILRKIAKDSRVSLKGAKFTIHKGAATGVALKNVDDGTEEFTSDASGAFYVGELDYGTYFVEEIETPDGYVRPAEGSYFIVTVSEQGVGYKQAEEELVKEIQATRP